MQIDFFEEFLNDDALSRASLIKHPCVVFLAAPSLDAFDEAAGRLVTYHKAAQPAYWPLLEKSYWISPFSYLEELEGLRQHLLSRADRFDVLFDLELPLVRRSMFLKGWRGFLEKRRRIAAITRELDLAGFRIHTAEYPPTGPVARFLMSALGITFPMDSVPHHRIVMYYTSMLPRWIQGAMRREIRSSAAEHGRRFAGGLGTTAVGIFGNEPRLSPEDLDRDLGMLKASGVKRAVIFRLGGITQEYADVIHRYAGD
ncbi:MAG: hypothetical protein HY042_02500 [Spirochaetia bacterium]|nr:hypothetical protein [Spirochaetia bacterium]